MISKSVSAPAKINLHLSITGKRADGYHELSTVFQKVTLFDEISVRVIDDDIIRVTTSDPKIPDDSTNLAHKAAALLKKKCGFSQGISVDIIKKIPSGGGLGGGSSDAAACLLCINDILDLGLTSEELLEAGVKLGADVPFFIRDFSTAYATGIGEQLRPVRLNATLWFLIVIPDFSISTAWAYQTFSRHNLLTKNKKDINLIHSINDVQDACSILYNDFEQVVMPSKPEIAAIKNDLVQAGACGALLSGSGSSVFGVFDSKESCDNVLNTKNSISRFDSFIVQSL